MYVHMKCFQAEFIDGGTETEFEQDAHVFKLTATTSECCNAM